MFVALILICGVEGNPMATNGCLAGVGKKPFLNKETCEQVLEDEVHRQSLFLPKGVFVNHYTCVPMGVMS